MHAQQADQHRRAIPVMVALIVAIVGQAAILFNDFGSGNGLQGAGNPGMITAAAVSRAGATEVPSTPPIQQAVAAKTAT
jgi:hypothetical protein